VTAELSELHIRAAACEVFDVFLVDLFKRGFEAGQKAAIAHPATEAELSALWEDFQNSSRSARGPGQAMGEAVDELLRRRREAVSA
jgi:hypothetical protein